MKRWIVNLAVVASLALGLATLSIYARSNFYVQHLGCVWAADPAVHYVMGIVDIDRGAVMLTSGRDWYVPRLNV